MLIPRNLIILRGTPSAANAASWMLACIGTGVNRPFNFNDIIALRGLYGVPSPSCGGVDKRIINGVCETAIRVIASSEYDELHNRCYISYYYRWSNGEIDYEYTTMQPGQCP